MERKRLLLAQSVSIVASVELSAPTEQRRARTTVSRLRPEQETERLRTEHVSGNEDVRHGDEARHARRWSGGRRRACCDAAAAAADDAADSADADACRRGPGRRAPSVGTAPAAGLAPALLLLVLRAAGADFDVTQVRASVWCVCGVFSVLQVPSQIFR